MDSLLDQSTKVLQSVTFGDPDRRLTVFKPFSLHDDDRTEQVLTGEIRLASHAARLLCLSFS